MTFAIDKWKKNGWKIALWSAVGLIAIKFVIWPLLQGAYDKIRSVGKKEIGIAEWLPDLGPYWLIALAAIALGGLLIWAGVSKGEGAKKVKTIFELFLAFAKVALLVAAILVLTIFIIGPKMFWKGDYNYQPPQQTAGVGTVVAQATPVVPQSRTITVPVGDINAPPEKWSEEIKVVPGWDFRCSVVGQEGKMGVLVDGATKVVSEPGKNANTHATQSLRFISLEGWQLMISVAYYR